ncbi:hypothetical protein DFH09DRAFT_1336636 [Mycena vulgaris]|nr:hypothetical protein DFH09DRAFT_1336636 [Mycena vulgaris]
MADGPRLHKLRIMEITFAAGGPFDSGWSHIIIVFVDFFLFWFLRLAGHTINWFHSKEPNRDEGDEPKEVQRPNDIGSMADGPLLYYISLVLYYLLQKIPFDSGSSQLLH